MNKEQMNYALAKAKLEVIEETEKELEKDFLLKRGYRNSDGEVPSRLWMVDDEDQFEKLSKEFHLQHFDAILDLNVAEKEMKEAEDALIDYGLSIVPKSVSQTLNLHRNTYSVRKKLLDLTFRLDAKTVV